MTEHWPIRTFDTTFTNIVLSVSGVICNLFCLLTTDGGSLIINKLHIHIFVTLFFYYKGNKWTASKN